MLALTSSELDITDAAAVERVIRPGDVVINSAAFTRVDDAETEQDRAYAVNVDGPAHLARACATAGARLIHISTDYVFPGTRRRPYEIDDETGPVNVYGRTKLEGERAVLAAFPGAHVVRTSWVYEGDGTDFVAVMRRRAVGDSTVEAVADQTASPTYAGDLAAALLQIADGAIAEPVLHVVNDGAASRYDQARAVFEAVGADPERVRPVTSESNPRPARRPTYTALSGRRSVEAGLTPPRPWREALQDALSRYGRGGPLPSTP